MNKRNNNTTPSIIQSMATCPIQHKAMRWGCLTDGDMPNQDEKDARKKAHKSGEFTYGLRKQRGHGSTWDRIAWSTTPTTDMHQKYTRCSEARVKNTRIAQSDYCPKSTNPTTRAAMTTPTMIIVELPPSLNWRFSTSCRARSWLADSWLSSSRCALGLLLYRWRSSPALRRRRRFVARIQ